MNDIGMPVPGRVERWLRSLPALAVDGALALLALAAQLAPFFPGGRTWPLSGYLVAAGVSLPVLFARRAPFAALMVSEAAAAAYTFVPDGPRQPLWYGALIAMFTTAALAPRWQRRSAIVIIGWGAFVLTGSVETAVRGALLWTAAYAMGRAWASRQEHVRLLRERALHLERERELEAERERSRIARDMHDVLAHAVAVTVAQAEAGPIAMRHGPARTEEAFDAIADAGRDAMAQVRRILGVLNGGAAPTLAGIRSLVDGVSRAGTTEVTLTVTGRPGRLSPDAETAAYRIVQEALTNMTRHARATTASVTLDWTAGRLTVTVLDDGIGATEGEGYGLSGMRQRAAGCGGEASAGPVPGGGFRVRAWLPVGDRR
ncbi:sensor histidine kinase [Actinoplanes sp. CA-252034]|uniref:sensor histidine kinase n=1 Tax=Actinoplanes sp. CA-252034 TaxID=3239906 RepID=UPI003D95C292